VGRGVAVLRGCHPDNALGIGTVFSTLFHRSGLPTPGGGGRSAGRQNGALPNSPES
jgi:hypothetical protein